MESNINSIPVILWSYFVTNSEDVVAVLVSVDRESGAEFRVRL
jgi:hypothetical protein